jgi:FtsP/CotA-like multicopper oxidase with cupredoxin domain
VNAHPVPSHRHRWLALGAGVLLFAGACAAGRALAPTGQGRAASAFPSYDIGAAVKPAPTGRVREFQLVARQTTWEVAPGVTVPAIGYNGQVPGPTIRVTEGDTVRVTLANELEQPTSIHWHGLHVPNNQDGVVPFSQPEIKPGERFTYEFTASHAGTFMYHSHQNAVDQIDRGLYAPLIIDPATPPAATFDKEFTMVLSARDTAAMPPWKHPMADGSTMAAAAGRDMGGMAMAYNVFTINGKAFPSKPAWTVKEGDLVRVRIVNISNLVHPMHLHGHDFTVVAKDGEPVRPEAQQTMNTLSVNAGETYDVVFRADNPGTWVWHCHELHHTENDGVEPGGLIQPIVYGEVSPATPPPSAPSTTTGGLPVTATPMPSSMPGMKH